MLKNHTTLLFEMRHESTMLDTLRFKLPLNLTNSANVYWCPFVLPQPCFTMAELTLLSPHTQFCPILGTPRTPARRWRSMSFMDVPVRGPSVSMGIWGPPPALLKLKHFWDTSSSAGTRLVTLVSVIQCPLCQKPEERCSLTGIVLYLVTTLKDNSMDNISL